MNSCGRVVEIGYFTEINKTFDIDLSNYKSVIAFVRIGNGYVMGVLNIPVGLLNYANNNRYILEQFQDSSNYTYNVIILTKSNITIEVAITNGWTWGGIRLYGIN